MSVILREGQSHTAAEGEATARGGGSAGRGGFRRCRAPTGGHIVLSKRITRAALGDPGPLPGPGPHGEVAPREEEDRQRQGHQTDSDQDEHVASRLPVP